MTRKIRIRRGYERDLPMLDGGELAITVDTNKVFFGTGVRNMRLASMSEVETILGVAEGDLGDLAGMAEIQETLSRIQVYANEAEFEATYRQTSFLLPGTANPNSGWIEVFVNGLRLPKKSFRVEGDQTVRLLIDASAITAGTKIIVKWPEDTVPAEQGHANTHREGGPDELLMQDLQGYDEINQPLHAISDMVTERPAVSSTSALPTNSYEGEVRLVRDANLYYIRQDNEWLPLKLGDALRTSNPSFELDNNGNLYVNY